MSKSFIEGIKTPFANMVRNYTIKTKDGEKTFSYLSWALAVALADRPAQELVKTPSGALVHPVFGGGIVGVAQRIGDGLKQVTWLAILNGANQAMPEARITSRDVSDHINRCRAKAVAMVNGVGLPIYVNGHSEASEAMRHNVALFMRTLGVKPDDDLSTVQPFIQSSPEKNGEFIDWTFALAAARITDPNFHWEVEWSEVVDRKTGEVGLRPYFPMGTGWGVAVRVTYKGEQHTEYLPIMGFAEVETTRGVKVLDHQPLLNPNAHDWNRSVMRCLTKAIAYRSGYGQSVYAKADVDDLHVEPLQRKAANDGGNGVATQGPGSEPEATQVPEDPAAKAELIAKVTKALEANGRDAKGLLGWLGHKDATDLSVASVAELERGLKALSTPSPQPPAAAKQNTATQQPKRELPSRQKEASGSFLL